MTKQAALVAFIGLSVIVSATVRAQSSKGTELTKGDLTGANIEIIVGTVEVPPGVSGVLTVHIVDKGKPIYDSGQIGLRAIYTS